MTRAERAERAQKRWRELSPNQQRAQIRKMQEGRRKANGPEALAKVEKAIDKLGKEFKALERGHPRRIEILKELRPLGNKRVKLAYNDETETPETLGAAA